MSQLLIKNELDQSVHVTPALSSFWPYLDAVVDAAALLAATVTGIGEVVDSVEALVELPAELSAVAEETTALVDELRALKSQWQDVRASGTGLKDLLAAIKSTWSAMKKAKSLKKRVQVITSGPAKVVEEALDKIGTKIEKVISDLLNGVAVDVPAHSTVDIRDTSVIDKLIKPSEIANLLGVETMTLGFLRQDRAHIQVDSLTSGTWQLQDNAVRFSAHPGVPYLWHDLGAETPVARPPDFRSNGRHAPSIALHGGELYLAYGLGERCFWMSYDGQRWSMPAHMNGVYAVSGVSIASAFGRLFACWFDGQQLRLASLRTDGAAADDENDSGHWTMRDPASLNFNLMAKRWVDEAQLKMAVPLTPTLIGNPSTDDLMLFAVGLDLPNADDNWTQAIYFSNLHLARTNLPVLIPLAAMEVKAMESAIASGVGFRAATPPSAAMVQVFPPPDPGDTSEGGRRLVMLWQDLQTGPTYVEVHPYLSETYSAAIGPLLPGSSYQHFASAAAVKDVIITLALDQQNLDEHGVPTITYLTHRYNRDWSVPKQMRLTDSGSWTDHRGSTASTRHRPAVAAYHEQIHAAWRDPEDEQSVWWSTWNSGGPAPNAPQRIV